MPRSLLFIIISLSWSCSDTGVKAFNAEPEATITSHRDGDKALEGYTESFRGAVSDPDHAADDLTATWYLDGEVICESAAPEADGITTCEALISSTASEVTLEVQDPENAAGSDQVTLNVVPTDSPEAEITNPTTDGVYYSDQLITFEGVVSDREDAARDLIVSWESNLDGDLEIDSTPNDDGEVIDYSYLTEGEHAVELDVSDTTGKTGTASVIVQVGPPNSAPTCGITAPDDSSAGEPGDLVTFQATVADVDVAPDWLTASWSSDKDGEIGTSAPTSAGDVTFPYADLSVNTHVITLSVADEIGGTCTDDIVYTVGTAPLLDCPLESYGGSDYYFCTDSVTHAEAFEVCDASGMTLAVITSSGENDFLHVTQDYAHEHWWIGLQRVSGSWAWDDGSTVSYTNWDPGEPDGDGDCVEYDGTDSDVGEWYDHICTWTQPFICED